MKYDDEKREQFGKIYLGILILLPNNSCVTLIFLNLNYLLTVNWKLRIIYSKFLIYTVNSMNTSYITVKIHVGTLNYFPSGIKLSATAWLSNIFIKHL